MKHIKIFESFIKALDEIRLSNHWIERTSLRNEEESHLSRIISRRDNFLYGYRINNFIDKKRNEYNNEYIFSSLNKNENILNILITKSLYALTRSKRLRSWKPDNDKEIQLMKLGKICIYDGENKYYPLLAAGKEKGGEYVAGEIIWGFTKEKDLGITVKYYPDTKMGNDLMYKSAREDSKLTDFLFHRNSKVVYPYGENFEIIIDLTDPDLESIERKINDQAEGKEIKLGPEPEKVYIPLKEKEILRKTISPGDEIGLIVGYVSKDIPILGIVNEIININEIKDAQKIRSLDSIKEIKLNFIPSDPKNRRFGKDGKILPVTINLKDGSIIQIKGNNYKILGPSGGKPLLTSEPSIINTGSVQTWVESKGSMD